ncbi:class I SAM-dependent methyltransferase [Aromatoleum aromaticum]|nr:class I SAM-dependent methyltransferase [Aromatoleum aromaticum]
MTVVPRPVLRLLRVVEEGGFDSAPVRGVDERRVVLRFDADADEFAVGDCRLDGGVRRLSVHPRWRGLGADFQQQLANRHFTDELLVYRPDVIVIDGVTGASLDMVRVGALLGYPVLMRVPGVALPPAGSRARLWLADVVALASGIYVNGDEAADAAFRETFPARAPALAASLEQALQALQPLPVVASSDSTVSGYAHYAFGLRDHGLLYRMQLPLARHFDGCSEVLEVACGTAVFLDILRQRGIAARGVERDSASVRYARGLGFDIEEADALDYLAGAGGRFDGIYCSHFVEHLDTAGVDRLISLIAHALRPGGVAVFVFPDPESIRSQLLGFWRDPEHVRFYHPDLIELMCRGHGLDPEFHSHRADGREVVPFAWQPPLNAAAAVPNPPAALPSPAFPVEPAGRMERMLRRFGIISPAALRRLENAFTKHVAVQHEYTARLQSRVDELEGAVRSLWAVNQTWAWDDNAVIRVRKPA